MTTEMQSTNKYLSIIFETLSTKKLSLIYSAPLPLYKYYKGLTSLESNLKYKLDPRDFKSIDLC